MKKLLLSLALLISCASLNAGIIGDTLDTAENLADDALAVPGDVLYGPEYYNDGYYAPRYGYRDGYSDGYHHGVFGIGRRHGYRY